MKAGWRRLLAPAQPWKPEGWLRVPAALVVPWPSTQRSPSGQPADPQQAPGPFLLRNHRTAAPLLAAQAQGALPSPPGAQEAWCFGFSLAGTHRWAGPRSHCCDHRQCRDRPLPGTDVSITRTRLVGRPPHSGSGSKPAESRPTRLLLATSPTPSLTSPVPPSAPPVTNRPT